MNDGGPAFPHTNPETYEADARFSPGMSLRDYFAAAALQGMLANEDIRNDGRGTGLGTPEQNATNAYQYADAMLAERSKP